MSKRNFVCFDCRVAVRREPYSGEPVLCPSCGGVSHNIGYKIPVPPKNKKESWDALREEFFRNQQVDLENRIKSRVRRTHALDKEIEKLESRPENEGRAKEIRRLRKQLESIQSSTATLFRPVGPAELDLIRSSDWTRFPPRLPEQPIFYPVLNQEYARQIARDWNVKDSGAGFVTRFEVDKEYIRRFPRKIVGGSVHEELWVPSEELDEFNSNIVGPIELVESFGDDGV